VVDPVEKTDKVVFRPFIGISPYRYRDLFEKGKRKYSGGLAYKWNLGVRRPMIEVYFPSYFKAEAAVVGQMRHRMEAMVTECKDVVENPGYSGQQTELSDQATQDS
jgi:hypothetical protein